MQAVPQWPVRSIFQMWPRSSRWLGDVVNHYGRVDILVNNAGVIHTKPMLDVTAAEWHQTIDVNQSGTFFVIQAVAEQMIRQLPEALRDDGALADIIALGEQDNLNVNAAQDLANSYGKIVSISSISGRKGRPLATAYAASKAAIISITQSAALALAPYRINVNAICPGVVLTSMWERIDKDRAELFGAKPGEAVRNIVNAVPFKRTVHTRGSDGCNYIFVF